MLYQGRTEERDETWSPRLSLAAPHPRRPRSGRARYEPRGEEHPFRDLSGRAEIMAVTAEWLIAQAVGSLH